MERGSRNQLEDLLSPGPRSQTERDLEAEFGIPAPPHPLADRTPAPAPPRAYLRPEQIVTRVDARQRGGVTR